MDIPPEEMKSAPKKITAKESVLTRVKALISSVDAGDEHDEAAIVAWIKAKL